MRRPDLLTERLTFASLHASAPRTMYSDLPERRSRVYESMYSCEEIKMTLFILSRRAINLPAVQVTPQAPTRDIRAWQSGKYVTVRLFEPVAGLRVHTNNKSYPGRLPSAATGAWVALDDVIQTSGELIRSRALPGPFTDVGEALLPVHCTLNVGVCAPLFDQSGGGIQAEYVCGPAIQFTQITEKRWHGKQGSA